MHIQCLAGLLGQLHAYSSYTSFPKCTMKKSTRLPEIFTVARIAGAISPEQRRDTN